LSIAPSDLVCVITSHINQPIVGHSNSNAKFCWEFAGPVSMFLINPV